MRSGCTISWARVLNVRAFRIGFCEEGKSGVTGEKPLAAEKKTNNKLNPHWWNANAKGSALTTAVSLLPLLMNFKNLLAFNLATK